MGTYTTLYLNEFDLACSKSAVIPEVMTVFVESDRRSRWLCSSDREVVELPTSDDDFEQEVEYVTTVEKAAHRLDVMGFTLERCRRDYEEIRNEELEGLRHAAKEDGRADDGTNDYYAEEIGKYERLGFNEYVAGFKAVFERNLRWYDLTPEQRSGLDATESYILDDQNYEWPNFGFLCRDFRSFLRMALTVAGPEVSLRQDISELVSSGWVRQEDLVRDDAVGLLVERYPENAPRIVLTEGSSDAEILRTSLAVLFPHLVGYYTFFDFHSSKAAGGATQLISVVKAFAAAGVANRVIALLDNDTAAHEARRALRDVQLPENIAIVHCPPRDWLREYPTLGPSGEVSLDVNGKAASIEIYFGRDILTVNGQLCPVLWAGYSHAMRAYQGEVLDKPALIERWKAKADLCLAEPTSIVPADWADMRAIWEQIMAAFPA